MSTDPPAKIALPPIRAVQTFEAIVRCGRVATAADELGVSSSAASQQLHKLESKLGIKLLRREGRTLTLTSLGRIYYEQVQRAFDELRRGQHRIQNARAKHDIVISALPSLTAWLQQPIMDWGRKNPLVSLRLVGSDKEPSLREESIDFRLCYGADARRHDRSSELFCDAIIPACSPGYLRRNPVKTAQDILSCSLIDIVWDSRHRQPPSWADWAQSAGLVAPKKRNQLAFSLTGTAVDAALDDRGFVLGQLSVLSEHVRRGRLVIPVNHPLKLPESYYLTWERDTLDRQICADLRMSLIASGNLQQQLAESATLPICQPQ